MRLTKRFIESVSESGRYADDRGDGLYLNVKPTGAKSWVQRLTVQGRRHDIGLGSARYVTLQEARDAAYENRRLAARGGDPLADKRRAAVPTFERAMEAVIALNESSWRNQRTVQTFRNSLATHAARLMKLPVNTISSADILQVLTPLWNTKRQTAKHLRVRIGTIMRWALAHEHIQNDPMLAVAQALPRNGENKSHHRTLPHAEIADALAKIREVEGWPTIALAIEFVALTAVRSGEARGALWSEIDMDARLWTIPGERMKTGKAHRVPLSDRAMELLEAASGYRNESGLIFPAARGGQLHDAILTQTVAKAGLKDSLTIHGLRSCFRDWCADTNKPREIAEAALAHALGSRTEAAYLRSDVLERRRLLMEQWADYVTRTYHKIVKIHG